MFINLNLDLCLQLFSISFLMFSKFIDGMLLYSIINNFSVEHRLHREMKCYPPDVDIVPTKPPHPSHILLAPPLEQSHVVVG